MLNSITKKISIASMATVEKVFVFEQSGVPRVMFDFFEHQLVMDEILLSGFLSAIDGFSENLFQNPSSHFVINHGDRKISLFRGNELVIAAVSQHDILALKPQMDKLLQFFADNYEIGQSEVQEPGVYDAFRRKLIRTLFYIPICDDWIPIPRTDHSRFFDLKLKFPYLEAINAQDPINPCPHFSNDDPEPTYELFNFLYFEGAISFRNHIEERDYILGLPQLITAIQGNQQLFTQLSDAYPKFDLIRLIKELRWIQSVSHIKDCFKEDVIPVLNFLFEQELLLILDENQRKIAIVAKIVEDLLQILLKIEKRKKLQVSLSNILDKMKHPEILAQIDLEGNHFVSLHNHLPSVWDLNEINRIVELWGSFGRLLISHYYRKYPKQLNQRFYEHLLNHLLPSMHSNDLGIIDPILHTIEEFCIDV